MKLKITNPIYFELKNLKLINKKNLKIISNQTRDKKIKVFQDKEKKIIFLEKCITSKEYYSGVKYSSSKTKTSYQTIKSFGLKDDLRRAKQFQKFCTNKHVLDFGCGRGNFLKVIKKAKSLNGIEIGKQYFNIFRNIKKKIDLKHSIDEYSTKFDVITMFHVLEHLPSQVKVLKQLHKKLKKNGLLIVEIPHANDFLLNFNELKDFKKFTFWSEHLILHTRESIKSVLEKAGYKNIKIIYFQRYPLSNHLGWFIKKKPGGHDYFKHLISKSLNLSYINNLVRLKQTDTLIVTAKA